MINVTVGERKTHEEPEFNCPCLVDWDGQVLLLIEPAEEEGEYVAYNFSSKKLRMGFVALGALPVTNFKGQITLENIQQ